MSTTEEEDPVYVIVHNMTDHRNLDVAKILSKLSATLLLNRQKFRHFWEISVQCK